MKNARFWEFVNGGWVKITLKPGQFFRWGTSYPTDEGYHAISKEWWYGNSGVHFTRFEGGRDCDGSHSYTDEYFSMVPLKFKEWEHSPSGTVPIWEKKHSRCYDQFAELMNY